MRPRLLFAGRDLDLDAVAPPAFDETAGDLHLQTVVAAMAAGDTYLADIARRVIADSLTEAPEILYRQGILRDWLANPGLARDLYALAVEAVEDRRRVWGWSLTSSTSPSLILSSAVRQLEAGAERLQQLHHFVDKQTGAFRSPGLSRFAAEVLAELDEPYFRVVRAHLDRLRFEGGILLSARLSGDNGGRDYVLRSVDRPRRWRDRLPVGHASRLGFSVSPRDEAGGQALGELRDRGVNLVADAVARSADHVSSYFTHLRAELGFYVGCLNLRDRLDERACPVSFPAAVSAGSGAWAARGLRDAALVLRNEAPVVGNDLEADGRSLVVVTGANSGGKSTFLRSVGLAQLMMQAGMFVVADRYRAAAGVGIFTHSIREEDRTLESGRLHDELRRMSRIADHLRPGALVLFNESFAGTNEQEGSEIATQVVRALTEGGVRVMFVTHQFPFADGCRTRCPDVLYLRADRPADGGPSYRLSEAPPLPTSFGRDLYERLGGWAGAAAGSRPAAVSR